MCGPLVPMGVVKIRRQGPGKDIHVLNFSLNYMVKKRALDDRLLFEEDYSDDSDDYNLLDSGCECALVNEQISNVPYGLYELPNLKDVISLDTWNLYLTEEERFQLAAYLPDMDQETFELTMIELLGGGNIFFGNPLEILFQRLKGGFYSPPVAHFRDGLKFLQKRGYHHFLRSYHESISLKCMEMRKAWRNCQPNTSVEERVQIWKDKKNSKPVFVVDLNAFPHDEELLSKGDKNVMGHLPPKKMTYTNEDTVTHVPTMNLDAIALNRTKAKGVLKIKPSEVSSTQEQVVLSLPTGSLEPVRRPPKGVLKIKPKIYSSNVVERISADAVRHDQSSTSVFGIHISKIAPLHSTSQLQEENIIEKLNYEHHFAREVSFYRGSPTPEHTNDQQSDFTLNIGYRLISNTHCSLRKTKTIKDMKTSTEDLSDFKKCFDAQQNGALWPISTVLRHSSSDNNRRRLMPFHINASEAESRNLITANDYQMLQTYPGHCKHRYWDKDCEGVEKNHMFPITCKRKKLPMMLSTLQNQKKVRMVASVESAVPEGGNFNEGKKTKAIKLRVKGWNEFNSQYK